MEESSQCDQCEQLKEDIRNQIDAFRILASLNPTLNYSILLGNLEELVGASKEEDVLKIYAEPQTESPSSENVVIFPNTCRVVDDDGTGQIEIVDIEETLSDPPVQSFKNVTTRSITPPPATRKSGRSKWRGSWEDKCRQIINDLWIHGDALPFRYPVNLKQCPDYNKVVKKPMCFEIVKEKLYGEKYTEPLQFHQDVLLIFQNCRRYNNDPTLNDHNKICELAQILEGFYDSLVQKLQLFDNLNLINNKIQISAASSSTFDDDQGETNLTARRRRRQEEESKRFHDDTQSIITNATRGRPYIYGEHLPATTTTVENDEKDDSLTTEKLKAADQFLVIVQARNRKLYKCMFCNRALTTQSNARLHVRRVHFHDRVQCQNCLRKFYDTNNLKGHLPDCKGGQVDKSHVKDRRKETGHLKFQMTFEKSRKKRRRQQQQQSEAENRTYKNLTVRNPFPNFDLKMALSAKVELDRLKISTLSSSDSSSSFSSIEESLFEKTIQKKKNICKKRKKKSVKKSRVVQEEKTEILDHFNQNNMTFDSSSSPTTINNTPDDGNQILDPQDESLVKESPPLQENQQLSRNKNFNRKRKWRFPQRKVRQRLPVKKKRNKNLQEQQQQVEEQKDYDTLLDQINDDTTTVDTSSFDIVQQQDADDDSNVPDDETFLQKIPEDDEDHHNEIITDGLSVGPPGMIIETFNNDHSHDQSSIFDDNSMPELTSEQLIDLNNEDIPNTTTAAITTRNDNVIDNPLVVNCDADSPFASIIKAKNESIVLNDDAKMRLDNNTVDSTLLKGRNVRATPAEINSKIRKLTMSEDDENGGPSSITQKKLYECLTCSKTFSNQSNCARHVRQTHFGERLIKCTKCGRSSYSEQAHRFHQRLCTVVQSVKKNLSANKKTGGNLKQRVYLQIGTAVI